MSDLKLDNAGDLEWDGRNLTVLSTSDNADLLRQRILIRLKTIRGEYFLDTNIGMPYLEDFFATRPTEGLIRSTIQQALLSTPGVVSVDEITVDFDNINRVINVGWRVTGKAISDGPLTRVEDEFILES